MAIALENYRYDMGRCTGCKGCVWVDHIYMPGVRFGTKCPSFKRFAFDAYAAYGRMKIALALLEGRLDYSPKLLDAIYACTLGGACDAGCKRNLDLEPLLVLEALRAKCVEEGQGPMPEHKRIAQNIEKSHNRFGAAHEKRAGWMPQDVSPKAKAEVVYFAGCAASYTHPEISQATVRILKAANVDFMVLYPDEWCCGNILYTTGQVAQAKKQAEHNIEAVRKAGASTVLVSCAECYKTWKVDYPKLFDKSTADMEFKVLHLSEYVEQLIKEGALTLSNKFELKVTYHDPCNLGRLSEPWVHWEGKHGKWGCVEPPKEYRRGTYGVYEPPRNILKGIPGIELVEMVRHRENAWCCGAGGGVREAFKDFALWTAGERLEEAGYVGAEAIVSCCPHCEDNFNEAAAQRKDKIKIYDLSELIISALSR